MIEWIVMQSVLLNKVIANIFNSVRESQKLMCLDAFTSSSTCHTRSSTSLNFLFYFSVICAGTHLTFFFANSPWPTNWIGLCPVNFEQAKLDTSNYYWAAQQHTYVHILWYKYTYKWRSEDLPINLLLMRFTIRRTFTFLKCGNK